MVPYVKTTEVDAYMGTETAYQSAYPSFCRPAALPRLTDDYALPMATAQEGGADPAPPVGAAVAAATAYLTFTVSALVFVMSHLVLISCLVVAAGVGLYCGITRPKWVSEEPSS